MFRKMIVLSAVVAVAAALFGPALAAGESPEEKAIKARQGFMKLNNWSSGPIWGLLKGTSKYDEATAKKTGAALKALSGYPFADLFLPGTSKSDQPGKTRALKKIWGDMDGFGKALSNWQAAAAGLDAAAGQGEAAFMAAAAKYGETCGGCHKPYRAKDF